MQCTASDEVVKRLRISLTNAYKYVHSTNIVYSWAYMVEEHVRNQPSELMKRLRKQLNEQNKTAQHKHSHTEQGKPSNSKYVRSGNIVFIVHVLSENKNSQRSERIVNTRLLSWRPLCSRCVKAERREKLQSDDLNEKPIYTIYSTVYTFSRAQRYSTAQHSTASARTHAETQLSVCALDRTSHRVRMHTLDCAKREKATEQNNMFT